MNILQDTSRNKFFMSGLSQREKADIRRVAVNVTTKMDGTLVVDDCIFNRIILKFAPPKTLYNEDIEWTPRPELRDYQIEDLNKMLKLKHVLNCNKMGYGKTLEAIEYCRILNLKRILVLCPKSVIEQWKDQFRKWWPESSDFIVEKPVQLEHSQIYVTNYESIRNGTNFARLKTFRWDIIICDESHKIKNKDSKTAMLVKALPTDHKMMLTGTPILNKPNDLWSQLNWFGTFYSSANYWEFSKHFCDYDTFYGLQFLGLTPSDSRRSLLSEALSMISVGGATHNITQGKNYIDVDLTMTPQQRKFYSQVKNLTLEALDIPVKNALDQLIKMQQITSNPSMFEALAGQKNLKFEWIKDQLEATGEPMIVYSRFASTAKALQEYLGKDICELYIGDMDAKKREAAKQNFIKSDYVKVLVGTIGALGVGVDGLQNKSHTAVFLDKDWSPSLNEQAEDRLNRFGQKEQVNVYCLRMKHSIDMHVEDVIKHKSDDVEALRKWIQSWS